MLDRSSMQDGANPLIIKVLLGIELTDTMLDAGVGALVGADEDQSREELVRRVFTSILAASSTLQIVASETATRPQSRSE